MYSRKILLILKILLCLMAVLFFSDTLGKVEIKSETLKKLVYNGILVLPLTILVFDFFLNRSFSKNILSRTLIAGLILVTLLITPNRILFHSTAWSTQYIFYRDKVDPGHQIELQMLDMGALGYESRKVEVWYFTGLFMVSKPVETGKPEETDWLEINEEVNELGLKFP